MNQTISESVQLIKSYNCTLWSQMSFFIFYFLFFIFYFMFLLSLLSFENLQCFPSPLSDPLTSHFPVHPTSLPPTFWSTPNACTPVLFGPLLHLWALSTTRHMRRKQHLRFVAWRETIMLVVLGLISDMNDSTQSTIHIPQLYVLHSRAVLALRLCMPCAFQNVRFNTGDGVGI